MSGRGRSRIVERGEAGRPGHAPGNFVVLGSLKWHFQHSEFHFDNTFEHSAVEKGYIFEAVLNERAIVAQVRGMPSHPIHPLNPPVLGIGYT